MKWYVVKTQTRRERVAEVNLVRLGVETFSPVVKKTRISRGRKQCSNTPLFPGYIFVRLDLKLQFRMVRYAHGVSHLVAFGKVPAAVDSSLIHVMRDRLVDGCLQLKVPSFKAGQKVKIVTGPFKDFEGVFERSLGDQQRVMLLLKTLSCQARLIVHQDQVSNY